MRLPWVIAASVSLLLSAGAGVARGEPLPPPARDERVPLSANFGAWELWGFGGVVAWDLSFLLLERPIAETRFGYFGFTCPRCALGAPGGADRWFSDALYPGPGAGRFMGGAVDVFGLAIAPAGAATFYAVDALVQLARGRGFFGNPNADHEVLALLEACGIAMGLNQTAKVLTGRLRPYYALHRYETNPSLTPLDAHLSFFSGHTTMAFTLAAFVYRDFSDWLLAKQISPSSTGLRIFGRVAPAIVLYGTASVVGVSRIYDQAHYFSDVALGAFVGSAVGNIVYAVHFDTEGRPRSAPASAGKASLLPLPGGLGVVGQF